MMKRVNLKILFIISIIYVCIMTGCGEKEVGSTIDKTNISEIKAYYTTDYKRTFGEFTAKTTNLLLDGKKENTCYSPASLFAAWALSAKATEGQTREEFMGALGVKDMEHLDEVYFQMSKDITSKVDSKSIMLCNSLWLENSYLTENSDVIIEECQKYFACEIFKKDKVTATDVNEWVSEKTKGKIKEMLDNDISGIGLFNTIYYKSDWRGDFETGSEEAFYLENGESITLQYINRVAHTMEYKVTNDYTAVMVPLDEGEILFVLPKENKKLESLMNEEKINEILALATSLEMDMSGVDISIPEFSCAGIFESELSLMAKELGVNCIDSGLNWEISDKLDDIPIGMLQKTKIEVNRKGVEGVGATGLGSYLSPGGTGKIECNI